MATRCVLFLGVLLMTQAEVLAAPDPAGPGDYCLTCDRALTAEDVVHEHRGRRVALCNSEKCLDAWENNKAHYFAQLQPRGALFQEPAREPSPVGMLWFGLGIYVLVGLISGAACAYLAVNRARPAPSWFLAGLVGNVVALLAIAMLTSRGDTSALPAGIPSGLSKVPTTRDPGQCPHCASPNHPSANHCSTCQKQLTPTVASEVRKSTGNEDPQ